MERQPVCVLGAGLIGASWARLFLKQDISLAIWDPADGALAKLKKTLPSGDWRWCADPEEAVTGASFVQESGPEDLPLKRALLERIGSVLGPTTVIASSTSTLTPSDLQEGLLAAPRILIGHPFNPPELAPLVEVVPGRATAPDAVETAMAFYRKIGKTPIQLRRERPGHLANRLQAAVWREAIEAVLCGQATVAEVDAAMTGSLGPRWAIMGPFETFHLGGGSKGLDGFFAHVGPAIEALWRDMDSPELDGDIRRELAAETARAFPGSSVDAIRARDRKLKQILKITRASTPKPPRQKTG